jgi:hypothetical protein
MQDETFAGHRRFFWMWACLVSVGAMSAAYHFDHPVGGPSGGTTLGVIYGVAATAGIFLLMGYGLRRRYAYAHGPGTLKGWLSAHVWIGTSLAVVVPLHSGFKLARNLHAVPYALMLATIVSGFWGAFSYLRYPPRLRAQREGTTPKKLLEQLERASREMTALATGKSTAFAEFARRIDVHFGPSTLRIVLARPYSALAPDDVVRLLGTLPEAEHEAGLALTKVGHRKRQVANQLINEAGTAARMRVWLFLHVPLSFACVAAVLAHVFWVVFYKWSVR